MAKLVPAFGVGDTVRDREGREGIIREIRISNSFTKDGSTKACYFIRPTPDDFRTLIGNEEASLTLVSACE